MRRIRLNINVDCDSANADPNEIVKAVNVLLVGNNTLAKLILDGCGDPQIRPARLDEQEQVQEEIARLIEQASQNEQLAEDAFDETVHDAAAVEASCVNNAGVAEQITYLVMHLGVKETQDIVAVVSRGEDPTV